MISVIVVNLIQHSIFAEVLDDAAVVLHKALGPRLGFLRANRVAILRQQHINRKAVEVGALSPSPSLSPFLPALTSPYFSSSSILFLVDDPYRTLVLDRLRHGRVLQSDLENDLVADLNGTLDGIEVSVRRPSCSWARMPKRA